jgi:UDP-3-O-[3-hydroxymyristoyl] N-acetylglucosamine deacetylase
MTAPEPRGGPASDPRVVVEGLGLHTASEARVSLARAEGPVRVIVGGVASAARDLTVVSTEWRTEVAPRGGGFCLATVEHVFAALAGLGLHEGVGVVVDGTELPILDGAALAWCDALTTLGVPASSPGTRVVRRGIIDIGQSRYEFTPFDGIDVEVCLVLADDRLAPRARWKGDEADFRARIAPARTFAFECDIPTILRLGLARHVPPTSVVIIGKDSIQAEGHPFARDEPARHKLLDLMGDMYLAGGPPIGRVRALRPGHTANAAALRRARAEGLLADTRCDHGGEG